MGCRCAGLGPPDKLDAACEPLERAPTPPAAGVAVEVTTPDATPTGPRRGRGSSRRVGRFAGGPKRSPRSRRQPVLLPSAFDGRPPVLLFAYTDACGAAQRRLDRALRVPPQKTVPLLYYGHSNVSGEYNAVINVLRAGGLCRTRGEGRLWSLLWGPQLKPEVLRAMEAHQRANHFLGSWRLSRKDLLWKSIARMQQQHGRAFQIMPQSYVLPEAWDVWNKVRRRFPDALWIWKPCSSSCGRGIRVISSQLTEVDERSFQERQGIVQRYIGNPLTIDGYKFDLRIYVVVSSFDPLKVYLNDEGLVRLATQRYSNDRSQLSCRTMHLTNYSVNKDSPKFRQNQDDSWRRQASGASDETQSDEGSHEQGESEQDEGEREPMASKWSFSELRAFFAAQGLDYGETFARIRDLVIKTLIAAEGEIRAAWSAALEEHGDGVIPRRRSHTASCFEIYGFDVLIDEDLKPWLLEVNICPSLSSGSPLDKRIKTKLVADVLTLVGVPVPFRWAGLGAAGLEEVRPCSQPDGGEVLDEELPAPTELAERAARLSRCSGAAALAQFDELEWDLVLNAHDEDMRRGSLERLFPGPDVARYTPYFGEETYFNMVLSKWQQAGGGDLFRPGREPRAPPCVPRQVTSQVT